MTDVLEGIIGQARAGPNLPAVKDSDRALSYAELLDEAARFATSLRDKGVVEGDRVALYLPNSVEFVVAALGCLWIGAIFVPLATNDPDARLANKLADCEPAFVIHVDAHDDHSSPQWCGQVPFVSVSELQSRSEDPVPAIPPAPRSAYAMYTSGTTGTPKGVLIGTEAFGAAVEATANALALDRSTRTLCVSPFYFDGSFATLFPTLFSGGTVVIRPASLLLSRTFFNAVVNEKITYTGFSPSFLRLLLASPHIAKLADSTLDVIALGGEASSLADVRALWSAAPNIRVFNRYGPTETTIAVTHVHLTREVTSDEVIPIGKPHRSVTFHLVDSEGGAIADADKVGELYIGGVQLMTGYWGAPNLTEEVLRTDVVPGETVYRTGDLVYRDKNGSYVYVDRADRVVKRNGIRISLIELSEVIRNLTDISAATCLAFDDEGELGIVAFVVADKPVATIDLWQGAQERLPEGMLPNRFEQVDALPINKSNKLDEHRLLSGAGLRPLGQTNAPNVDNPSSG